MTDSKNIFSVEGIRLIFQNSHDAFIISDSDMKIIFVNKAAEKTFGYQENELLGLSILQIMPEDRRKNYCKDMEIAAQGKTVSNINSREEFLGLKKNGEVFPIELTYLLDKFGHENYFISQIRDISKRRNYERELTTTTTALRVINEANRVLIESNDEFKYLDEISKIICEVGGFSRSMILYIENIQNDVLVKDIANFGCNFKFQNEKKESLLSEIHPESLLAEVLKEQKIIKCQNIIGSGLWRFWTDDPKELDFESTIAIPIVNNKIIIGILRVYSSEPFAFSKPEIELLAELAKDISHGIKVLRSKKEHEITLKSLKESESKYRALFQSSNDAIFISDAETGIIIDINLKAEDLLGRGEKEIIGMHHLELYPEGYEEKFKKIFNQHVDKESNISDEFYIRRRDLKAVPVQISANVAYINGKKVIQGIFRDISQSKMQEEKIRAAQKMEALGTLSGGIAHDINNILSPIIGFTQLAILEHENKSKQIGYLNEVLTASNRAKDIVGQILTFSRKNETDKKPHYIQYILKEVVKLISVSLPSNVEIRSVIDENCEPVLCDPIQIYQILINLCTNAHQSMKENGGILKVCLVRKGSPEIKADKSEVLPFEDYISLIVSDTGCGMNKTTLDRIFEPYFTTKEKEEGTGLGLSVVSGIVKEHDGEIYVRTYPKEGTYFRISFPIVKPFKDKKEKGSEPKIFISPLKVMVVDDELQITYMLKHMLNELGYDTDLYNNPLDALETFKSDPYKYGLVITDQTMPKLLGTELSKKILAIRPDIPIILNTGFSPVASRSESKKIGIKEFMMKPITISDLSIVIERTLNK